MIFAGCNEKIDFGSDGSNDNSDNKDDDNDNNVDLSGPSITEFINKEKMLDYSYYVQSVECSETGECDSPSNMTVKVSHSLGYTLQISHKKDYTSYYLYDFNDMVARQWSPDREVMGSKVECHGYSIADYNPKNLTELNATIIGREQYFLDGKYVNCTHLIYYLYKTSSPDEINMIYEQWIWDDYGVKIKNHIYRPPEDPHLPDYDMTQTMSNFVFGGLTEEDFQWQTPCTISD